MKQQDWEKMLDEATKSLFDEIGLSKKWRASLRDFIHAIRREAIEEVIKELEFTPPGFNAAQGHTLQLWIELKQQQLRSKYL